jgi:hypothetical protein
MPDASSSHERQVFQAATDILLITLFVRDGGASLYSRKKCQKETQQLRQHSLEEFTVSIETSGNILWKRAPYENAITEAKNRMADKLRTFDATFGGTRSKDCET